MSTMVLWSIWLLLVTGIVYGIVESALLAPIRLALADKRPLVQSLLYCRKCTGFWVGLSVSILFSPLTLTNPYLNPILYGFVATGWIRLIDPLLGPIESLNEFHLLYGDNDK